MSTYGRTVLNQTGQPIQAAANMPEWVVGGVTIDWNTVGASAAATTLGDGTPVPLGVKALEYGVILCKINATGKYGPYTVTAAGTTTSAASLSGALALSLASAAGVVPGDVLLVDTGGTQESVSVQAVSGTTITLVAPAAFAHASGVAVSKPDDGRQALARGNCAILNESVLQFGVFGLTIVPTDHPGCFNGGLVWRARLKIGGAGQPSVAAFEAAFPRIQYAQ